MKFNTTRDKTRTILLFIVATMMLSSSLAAEASDNADWPDWRGPAADGRSEATGLPLTWSETENIAWKTPIHDLGYSTPVVWGDQIWLTTATKKGTILYAVCVDLNSGRIIHDVKVFRPEKPQRIHRNNSYATPSAVVEEGFVYVHYGTHGTACLDSVTGEVVWRRSDLHCEHMQGPVSSPILYEDLLIFPLEGTDVQFVIALDKKTGRQVWRYDRPRELYDGIKPVYLLKSYHTPVVAEINGQPQLINNGAMLVTGHDPLTGRELWRVRYRNDNPISRIISGRGLLFINAGGNPGASHLLAVRQGGVGDVTDTHVVWKMTRNAPHESSPVLVGNLLYLMSDKGVLTCKQATTGKTLWTERLEGAFGASLLYADGRIYMSSKEGKTTVIKPGPFFRVLAVNQLDGFLGASPAVAGKSLLLRTKTHLYRIQHKTKLDVDAWHNSDQWDPAGDAMLNPDNSRRLAGKPGTGVLINGKNGKCPSLVTKRRDYRDVEVHLEFMVAKGSNSGVIFHGNYEIQILDSYGIKTPNAGHCGGVYPRAENKPTYHHIDRGSPPRVNAAKRPGQWQTMDIIFQAARFDKNEKKTAHARFAKVVHNGIVIQENVDVPYACGPNWDRKQFPQGPIIIQGDYGPIAVRNIFIKEIKPPGLNVPPEGFTALFNGKDFTGWHTPSLVKEYWSIEDGVLKSPGLIEQWGACLATKKHYRDFILMLDFRMPTISDSGIRFRRLIPEIPGFGDMEQFNLRSQGGMGYLESYYFLPKETARKMGLKEE